MKVMLIQSFFHGIMSSRQRRNDIPFYFVNGTLVEGVDNVRRAVFTHFGSHFQPVQAHRPSMEALNFRTISFNDGECLVRLFTVEEVKAVVWDCDNFKCPSPNGISFGFVKEFWDILKDDFYAFFGGISLEW